MTPLEIKLEKIHTLLCAIECENTDPWVDEVEGAKTLLEKAIGKIHFHDPDEHNQGIYDGQKEAWYEGERV